MTYYITLHYIIAFQTPPTPKVTSGASTITCYTKYSPLAQHAGYMASSEETYSVSIVELCVAGCFLLYVCPRTNLAAIS